MGELSRPPGEGNATGAAARWAAARWAAVMQVGGETAATVANSPWTPVAMAKSSLTWRSAIYLGVSLAFGLGCFIGLTVGLALSLGLLIIWVGLPMLALMMVAWRCAAVLERQFVRAAFGVRVPSPYRRLPPGRNPLTKLKAMASDPATWKDLLYLALLFPVTLLEFVVSVAVWSATGMLLAMPVIVAVDGGAEVGLGFVSYWAGNPVAALPLTAVGVLCLVLAMYVTRVMAIGHSAWARLMLGPSLAQTENLELRRRTEHLRASRARGVDAAEFERRRIERDLHDGAQQRLLSVAMDIGRARAKLDDDPEGARALIEQAHSGTKEAIAELRDLARGIYPAILTDRGLDPALSGLAGRAPVPVEVEVDLPERPPAAVESIAYFIVAESLANIAKYARATRATVRVAREDRWVVVEVTDNGVGGAVARPEGGLAGLADRAATIDGMLLVDSPPGGPTIIRADLPCTW
ncbi:sensor histidine kinase [Actinomadura livida]|uniref:histidine kinase n=1 Tax=Actinomadura livida TaxID=79909 RepID=A0A7W7IIK3_9ACTN|nr:MULTISPECIES: sensor domain-containing protein [Actinomadura]MBB4777660.1 signal transduction histidine kinase [Actinomadura catellatispora]GGT99535.1 histidine kinase [Actinomadura livida]